MSEKNQVQENLDKMNRAFEAFKETNDKKLAEIEKRGEPLGETIEQVQKIRDEISELRKAGEKLQAAWERSKIPSKPDETADEELAFKRRAFNNYVRYGVDRLTPEEKRALLSAKDSLGGFLVPDDVSNEIIMNAYNIGQLRRYCNIMTTSSDTVRKPSMSQPSMTWGQRQGLAKTEDSLTAGQENIFVHPCSGLYKIHNDVLDDAAANVEQQITSACSRSIAAAVDAAIAAGTGDDQPEGVVTNTTVQARYVASGVADAISSATVNGFDQLKACYMGVKALYRGSSTAVWAMNSATALDVMQLKNAEGVYYWEPSTQAGNPDMIMGKPIAYAEGMPDVAANAYPIVFGDFFGYTLVERAGLSVMRDSGKYMEYDMTALFIKARIGGGVTLAEAFCPMKIATS